MPFTIPPRRDIKKVKAVCIKLNAFYKRLTNKGKNEGVISIGSFLHWIISLGGGRGCFSTQLCPICGLALMSKCLELLKHVILGLSFEGNRRQDRRII